MLIQQIVEVLELQSSGVTNFQSTTINATAKAWRRADWIPNQRMSCGTKDFGLQNQNQQKQVLHRVALNEYQYQ
jgi:hypothetical protein